MRRIWPTDDTNELDVLAAVAQEPRRATDRAWVMLNMVASLDGAIADSAGRAGGLSGPADRELFHALRAMADVILVGANTVRAENYGPPRLPPGADEIRRAQGLTSRPRLAVVSRSLNLDPDARFFSSTAVEDRAIVLTTEGALSYAPEVVKRLDDVADVRVAGEQSVDVALALRLLHDALATKVVLAEGGPTLNSQLIGADLLDELCLTVSPKLMGGTDLTIVAEGAPTTPKRLRLDRIFEHDAYLFLRYLSRNH